VLYRQCCGQRREPEISRVDTTDLLDLTLEKRFKRQLVSSDLLSTSPLTLGPMRGKPRTALLVAGIVDTEEKEEGKGDGRWRKS
jgi:hypothetical protein